MHGNVDEWCADVLRTYPVDEVVDPGLAEVLSTRSGDEFRVVRGGSWGTTAQNVRSAYRKHYEPDRRLIYLGFRFVLRPGSTSK